MKFLAHLGEFLLTILIISYLLNSIKNARPRSAFKVILLLVCLPWFTLNLVVVVYEGVGWFQKRHYEYAKTLIKPSEILLSDLQITFAEPNRRPQALTGRVQNNSAYALETIDLELRFKDCATTDTCETIAEIQNELYVPVPPGESREFHSYITGLTRSVVPKGTLIWEYSVKTIVADVRYYR